MQNLCKRSRRLEENPVFVFSFKKTGILPMFASTVRYEIFTIWEKVFDWSSPFIDRFLKMSLLRFYPGVTTGGKKETNCNWRWQPENRKKKQVYENNRPDRKFYSKWQTDRPWLDFNKEKNVMTCTTCIEFEVTKSVTPS